MRNSDLVFERVLPRIDRRPLLSYRRLEEVHDALQFTTQMLSEMIKAKVAKRSNRSRPSISLDIIGEPFTTKSYAIQHQAQALAFSQR